MELVVAGVGRIVAEKEIGVGVVHQGEHNASPCQLGLVVIQASGAESVVAQVWLASDGVHIAWNARSIGKQGLNLHAIALTADPLDAVEAVCVGFAIGHDLALGDRAAAIGIRIAPKPVDACHVSAGMLMSC